MYICTVTIKGQDGRLQSTAFFRFLSAITMAMPVGVPAVMIFCIVVALQKLRGQGITSLYPGQLKLAANVDIACFDKTGTLTGTEVSHSVCPHTCLVTVLCAQQYMLLIALPCSILCMGLPCCCCCKRSSVDAQ